MKKKVFIAFAALILLTASISIILKNMPITMASESLIITVSLDNLIKSSELIVIGEVKTNLASQWKDPNGRGSKAPSIEGITHAHGLFTDSLISINQTLKGDNIQPILRIRSFSGEIGNIRWEDEDSPPYIIKKTYLLFLVKDHGATAKVDPGYYVSSGAYQGAYEIVDGKAISANDEWILEELIAYIQNSLSAEALSPTLTPTLTELLIETLTPSLTPTEIPSPTVPPAELPTETPTELPTQTPLPTETATPTQ